MNLNDVFDPSKFRFIRNIFASSEDQLRNEYLSTFLYKDIEYIINEFDKVINEGEFSTNSKLSKRQCREEEIKSDLIKKSPHLKETIFKLEDHNLLRGNIAAFNFDDEIACYAEKFQHLFSSSEEYFNISKALLTIGNYGQNYGRLKRYGNKTHSTWRELLTQSENRKGFQNTKDILLTYLKKFIDDNTETNEEIINDYLQSHESKSGKPKNFCFYMIKYDSFMLWDDNQTNGYYYWKDEENKPYECYMLFRKQFNGRHWDPFLLTLSYLNENCRIENYGSDLEFAKGNLILLIENTNAGFKFKSTDVTSKTIISRYIGENKLDQNGTLLIKQDDNGVDLEDRIIKCIAFFKSIY